MIQFYVKLIGTAFLIMRAMVASGEPLICEFQAGTYAALKTFPIRNRILGRRFSLGVLVRGARECSRTLIAARCAAEQGRDICFAPNRAKQDSFRPITLIKQGTKLTATWENVWQKQPAGASLRLESNWWVESPKPDKSSVFSDLRPLPPQKRIYAQQKPTRVAHSTKSLKKLEVGNSLPEIF